MSTEEENKQIEFKIGMIGPSGSGKTSLLLAIYDEVSQRVHDNLSFCATNDETHEAMERGVNEFKSCLDVARNSKNGEFPAIPQIARTYDVQNYAFTLIISDEQNDASEHNGQNVLFSIKDYPGGWLGTKDFENTIVPELKECVTLLVPVSADIAMTWQETRGKRGTLLKKNALCRTKLQSDTVVKGIVKWIEYKVKNNSHAQLIFVPVKCEKYFNDNGGSLDQSKMLREAISELYIQEIESQLKKTHNTPEEVEKVNNLINCEIFSVDTYGIAELSNVLIKFNNQRQAEDLESSFRVRRHMGSSIHMKNAYELLINIVGFQVSIRKDDLTQQVNKQLNDLSKYEIGIGRTWRDYLLDLLFGRTPIPLSPQVQKEKTLEKSRKAVVPVSFALASLKAAFNQMENRQLEIKIIDNCDASSQQ